MCPEETHNEEPVKVVRCSTNLHMDMSRVIYWCNSSFHDELSVIYKVAVTGLEPISNGSVGFIKCIVEFYIKKTT